MGCKPSVHVEHNGGLYNEDFTTSKKLMVGFQFSKGESGLEANTQLALASTKKAKYSRVDELENKVEEEAINERSD